MEKILFHVDVNSAFLAWNAVWDLQHGGTEDIRLIPAIVGGDPENRHGIVLAKSTPAKRYGIVTGETLFSALSKCPQLKIVPPRYSIYMKASNAMVEILEQYSPLLERYSIDECFLDMGEISRKEALNLAGLIKAEISGKLGFTVNVGIGTNKLCAKMASDFQKPDRIHTLYSEEVPTKLWPLPVGELFMVGPRTAAKLMGMNIKTIGELANADPGFILARFMKFGMMIHCYANGIDSSQVHQDGSVPVKGMGNSTTLPYDLTDRASCHKTILSLLETLVPRLREGGFLTGCLSVHYTSADFTTKRRQRRINHPTDSMGMATEICTALFDEIWQGEPVRKIGAAFSMLTSDQAVQLSMLDYEAAQKNERLDQVIAGIRQRFGDDSLLRATFVASSIKSFAGGVDDKDYVFMNSNL